MRLVPSVSVLALQPLLACLGARGVPPDALAARLRIEVSDWKDDETRIAMHKLVSLWSHAEALLADADVGLHAAEHATFDSFSILSRLAAASPTVGIGLAHVVRYVASVTGLATYSLRTDGEVTTLALVRHRFVPPIRHANEHLLAIPHLYCGRASVRPWTLVDVSFRHARPRETREHARLFGAPVTFGAEEDGLRFSTALLDSPSRFRDDAHAGVLESTAERLSKRAEASDVVSAARVAVWSALQTGDLTIASAAVAMGMSERTLQRELTAHGTSHRALLDEVRAAYAEELLRTDAKLLEIALRLGFAEQTAFQRAFKRWTGRPPARFRGSR